MAISSMRTLVSKGGSEEVVNEPSSPRMVGFPHSYASKIHLISAPLYSSMKVSSGDIVLLICSNDEKHLVRVGDDISTSSGWVMIW